MLPARTLIPILLLLLSLAAPAVAQPSFNCAAQLTPTERAICDVGALGDLDTAMAWQYRQLQGSLPPAWQDELAAAQRDWLRNRDACGANRTCLTTAYQDRIERLAGLASGPGPQPAAAAGVQVTPEGVIERPRPDGVVEQFDPATGQRVMVFPDGTTAIAAGAQAQVQPVTPPVIPPAIPPAIPSDYARWSRSVSDSLTRLRGTFLRPDEAATLQASAPDEFFRQLEYNLRVLAFVTGQ